MAVNQVTGTSESAGHLADPDDQAAWLDSISEDTRLQPQFHAVISHDNAIRRKDTLQFLVGWIALVGEVEGHEASLLGQPPFTDETPMGLQKTGYGVMPRIADSAPHVGQFLAGQAFLAHRLQTMRTDDVEDLIYPLHQLVGPDRLRQVIYHHRAGVEGFLYFAL